MKRLVYILLLALSVSACGIPKGLAVSFDGISQIKPFGFYRFDVDAGFSVSNPSAEFDIRDAHGFLSFEGEKVLEYNVSDFTVPKGGPGVVTVRVSCRIAENYNFSNFLNLLNTKDIDTFKIDLTATLYSKGAKTGRTVVYRNVPASRFLK